MTYFKIVFKYADEIKTRIIPRIEIASLYHGFWINADFDYTTGSDALIWIPGARILYVVKIKKE